MWNTHADWFKFTNYYDELSLNYRTIHIMRYVPSLLFFHFVLKCWIQHQVNSWMGIKWNDSNEEWNMCWIFFLHFFPIFPKFIIRQKLQHHSTHFIYNLNLMCWKIKFYDYVLERHSTIMNSIFIRFWTTVHSLRSTYMVGINTITYVDMLQSNETFFILIFAWFRFI